MNTNDLNKLAKGEGWELRYKGDECARIANAHFADNDLDGYRTWRAKAEAWYKLANRINHIYPDLEPPPAKEGE